MTDFLQSMMDQMSGGRAKLITAKDGNDLLSKIREEINADCGNPACPVHGEGSAESKMPKSMAGIDPDDLDPVQAHNLAVGAATGAQLLIEKGEHKRATVLQEQAFLWLQIGERLNDFYSTARLLKDQEEEYNAERGRLREELEKVYSALQMAEDRNQELKRQLEVAEEE